MSARVGMWIAVALVTLGCSLDRAVLPAASDGGLDAPDDTGSELDASDDVGVDAATDPDAGHDGGVDGGTDGGPDAGHDAGPALPPPPTLAGLTLWLDERGQVGPASLSRWTDQSPAAHDATQPTTARQPSIGRVSGWPSPDFDGIDDVLSIGAPVDTLFSAAGGHLFVVLDNTGETPGADMGAPYLEPGLWASQSNGFAAVSWSASGPRAYVYDGGYRTTPRLPVTPGLHILEFHFAPGANGVVLRVDADPPVTTAMVGPALLLPGPTVAAGGNFNSTVHFAGRIACVVTTNVVQSPAVVDAMRTFLAAKYGVSVD